MKVEVVREHHGQDGSVSAGDIINVTSARASDLRKLGLVKAVSKAAKTDGKKDQDPDNKKKTEPNNKSKS